MRQYHVPRWDICIHIYIYDILYIYIDYTYNDWIRIFHPRNFQTSSRPFKMDLWLIRTRAMLMVSRLLLLDLPPQQGRQWTAKKSRSLAIGLGKLQTEGMQIFHIHPSSCPVRLKTGAFWLIHDPFLFDGDGIWLQIFPTKLWFFGCFWIGGMVSFNFMRSFSFLWGCSNDLQQPCKSMKYWKKSSRHRKKTQEWTSQRKLKDILPEYLFKERGTWHNPSGRSRGFLLSWT